MEILVAVEEAIKFKPLLNAIHALIDNKPWAPSPPQSFSIYHGRFSEIQ